LLGVTIKNFALVEQQELQFGQGLNAITGESGSGKSVLVSRARQGAISCVICSIFAGPLDTPGKGVTHCICNFVD